MPERARTMTRIEVERELKGGKTETVYFDVPFSPEEVELFRAAHQGRDELMSYAIRGSGISRTVAADFSPPWGYRLVDREGALSQARKTVDFINSHLTPERERFLLEEEIRLIRKIQKNLGRLFPEEKAEVLSK